MKDQEDILKGSREKWCITYGGAVRIRVGNSSEIIESRKKWKTFFKYWTTYYQWQILTLAKQWKDEGKIKTSSDQGKRIFH